MAPRRQPSRQSQAAAHTLDAEVAAKRTKRHLDELERSNYSEPSASYVDQDEEEEGAGKTAKGRARQTISDKRGAGKKKKSTMNIRTAVLYRKNLATVIDESGIARLPSTTPTYLTAVTGPPQVPPRLLCTICGYWGRYKCKKCSMAYCDLNCQGVHDETRCERRVLFGAQISIWTDDYGFTNILPEISRDNVEAVIAVADRQGHFDGSSVHFAQRVSLTRRRARGLVFHCPG